MYETQVSHIEGRHDLSISDLMSSKPVLFSMSTKVGVVHDALCKYPHNCFPVGMYCLCIPIRIAYTLSC